MKKAKILMVHNYYQIGGGEHIVFANEKQLLIDRGHTVFEYTRHNDEIKRFRDKLIIPLVAIFNLRTYFDVKKILKKENIDVVHCHNTFPLISPAVYYAAKSCNVSVVQTIHNFRFLCANGIFYRNGEICEECVNKTIFASIKYGCYRGSKLGTAVVAIMLQLHRWLGTFDKKVDKYIVLTEFNKKKLSILISKDKITVKPNFSPVEAKTNIGHYNKDNFIFVGRLEESKGIKFILNTWKNKDVRQKIVVIGDGPLRQYVKKSSNECEFIEYIGPQTHEKTMEYMKHSKALIFASKWYEGFPMVLLEAMSQGIAIITVDIGNAASIVVDSQIGLHYKSNDAQDFINKINFLNEQSVYERLGDSAKQYFSNKYTSTINYEMLINIYKEVMKSGKVNKISILGVNIAAVDMKKTLKLITENLDQIRGKYICVSNVHTTVMASEDDEYMKIQNSSFLSLPDGKPLSIIGKRKYAEMGRVTGCDLMKEIFLISEEKGYKHYFYGNTEKNLNKFISVIKRKYPRLNIVGYKPSAFRRLTEEENDKLIKSFNDTKADFGWIALGAPKQEIFMYKNRAKTNCVMIGVGGAFNVMAGISPRAPKWMQACSLEWLFRLFDDPKRLWKRYLVTNTKFIWKILFRQ